MLLFYSMRGCLPTYHNIVGRVTGLHLYGGTTLAILDYKAAALTWSLERATCPIYEDCVLPGTFLSCILTLLNLKSYLKFI